MATARNTGLIFCIRLFAIVFVFLPSFGVCYENDGRGHVEYFVAGIDCNAADAVARTQTANVDRELRENCFSCVDFSPASAYIRATVASVDAFEHAGLLTFGDLPDLDRPHVFDLRPLQHSPRILSSYSQQFLGSVKLLI